MATKKKAATRSKPTRSTKKKAATRPKPTRSTKKKAATRPAELDGTALGFEAAEKGERSTRRPGRPAGSTNDTAGVVDQVLSRCPKCQSTNRSAYWGKIERDCRVVRDGVPCTHLVLRSTRCTDCGTIRRDRHFENRPTPVADQVEAKRDQVDPPDEPTEKRRRGRGPKRRRGVERGLVG